MNAFITKYLRECSEQSFHYDLLNMTRKSVLHFIQIQRRYSKTTSFYRTAPHSHFHTTAERGDVSTHRYDRGFRSWHFLYGEIVPSRQI